MFIFFKKSCIYLGIVLSLKQIIKVGEMTNSQKYMNSSLVMQFLSAFFIFFLFLKVEVIFTSFIETNRIWLYVLKCQYADAANVSLKKGKC